MKKSNLRDMVMAILMVGAVLFVLTHPAEKQSAVEKLNLVTFVPEVFASWRSNTYDTSNYSDKWQSINEILMRTYYKEKGGFSLLRKASRLNFVLEYSSDLRKNFSFHFPENCHRASGNEVEFLKPLQIEIESGKVIKGKRLFIRGKRGTAEEIDKVVVYWLVIDGKQYYETLPIKLDQMVSGLLKQSKRGFLVRFDYFDFDKYTPENLEMASQRINEFVRDLYDGVDEKTRKLIFGGDL